MPLTKLTRYTQEEIQEAIKDKKPIKIRIVLFFDGTLNDRKNIEEREKRELGPEKLRETALQKLRKMSPEDLGKLGLEKCPDQVSEISPETLKKLNLDLKVDAENYAKFTKDSDISANSYDNGRTNIATMEPHVSKDIEDYAGDYDLVYKHYIPGQGPITYQKDVKKGYALGIGESGVARRAEQGVRYAVDAILNDQTIERKDQYIQELRIDVFGFSRGAAAARYAIHVILTGRLIRIDMDSGDVGYTADNVASELNRFDYIVKNDAVTVGFAGLYDTVLSVTGTQYLPNKLARIVNILQQTAVKRAQKSLHLNAADEHRKDFTLINIRSAVSTGTGEEYYLPGVHSDVGGSYNQANDLILGQETDEDKKQYMRRSSEGLADLHAKTKTNWYGKIIDKTMVINQGEPERIEQDRTDLIAQGWYTANEIRSEEVEYDPDTLKPIESVLTVSRQGISSAYCNIPLKIMAKAARGDGVKLKINPKLEDIADKILDTAQDPKTGKNALKELEAKIEDYMGTHKNTSTPDDWIGDDALKNYPALKTIRNKHFHFSASKMSLGYKPRFEWDSAAKKYKRKRYYQDA